MEHSSQPRPISWFQEEYKTGRLTLKPPFQRKPVWTNKQRSALIESILINVPVPEVFVQASGEEDGTQRLGVVDGQQRLRTILQFVGLEKPEDQEGSDNNNFVLDSLPDTSPHKDRTFADVVGEERKRFYKYEICVRFLYTENRSEIEDVFKRLNKFSMPLRPQELRNATFHGAFARLSEHLADDEYWAVNRIVAPAAIRRMADIEMMSDLLIGLLHGPQGGSAKVIDQYYEQYESFADEFPEQGRVQLAFRQVRSTIQRVLPAIGETRWGNRADFYSLFVALGSLLQTQSLPKTKEKGVRDKLLRLANEVDKRLAKPLAATSASARIYARAIEKGSNDKARRVDRHEAILSVVSHLFADRR